MDFSFIIPNLYLRFITKLIYHFRSYLRCVRPNPRIDRTKEHKLIDILAIAICGMLCGADNWVAMEEYGKAKEEWLKQFLELPNGIPSHDTIARVFARIDPKEFGSTIIPVVATIYGKQTE